MIAWLVVKLGLGGLKTVLGPYLVTGGLIVGALVIGGAVAYHYSEVSAAYDRGASAAREQCSVDAAKVRRHAEKLYELRALRLNAELQRLRHVDEKADDAEKANQSLETELAKMKDDPVCWSPNIVKEIQK